MEETNSKSFQSSDNVNELFTALAKAQGAMGAAKKDANNPFFKSKYADLHSCWEAIRKPFADNALSIMQLPSKGNTVILTTVLGHASGQWMSNVVELRPVKTDPQGIGSAMTYARRYGLMAIAGIAPEEDDGNGASQPGNKQYDSKQQQPDMSPEQLVIAKGKKVVTGPQLKRLKTIASGASWDNETVSFAIDKMFNKNSSKKLNMKEYDELVEMIQNNTPEDVRAMLQNEVAK